MKISKKPFSLDPNLANLKDNITSTSKQMNWATITKELKKFGIRIDGEKKAKIIEGRTALICEILSKLFDFDNSGGHNSSRVQDGNLSEVNYGGDRDNSPNGFPPNDSTNISIDGKDSTSILLGAPVSKKQELDPLSPQGLAKNILKSNLPNQLKNIINSSPSINEGSPTKSQRPKGVNQSVTSLNDINESKDIGDAETTLEFILLSLAKNLGIKPKQAAGLLSNNHKYLVHIAVKGMKGNDYSKIQQWYRDIYGYSKQITQLIDNEKEHNAMKLTLNILKCGLFSQSPDIVINCSRVLSTIGQEINQIRGQLSGLAWDWFTDSAFTVNNQISLNDIQVPDFNAHDTLAKQMGEISIGQIPNPVNESGLASCVYAIKKNQAEVIDHIAPIFAHFGKNNYMEMFTHHLKNQFSDKSQFFALVHDLVMVMNGSSLFNEAIFNSGVLDEWINMAVRQADFDGQNTIQERIAAIAFLVDTWEIRSEKIEDNNDIAQAILTVLKRGCRDRCRMLRTVCFEQMFKLLHLFSVGRNQFAPVIYKSLTFLLIEFHMDGEIREQIMRHFTTLFSQVQTIPVAILCEPLLKQIEISAGISYDFNIFDFEFLNTILHHKRINIGIGLQVAETMVNVATSNIFFANSSVSIILEVVQRFSKEAALHQQFSIIIRQQLQIFEDLERQKSRADQDLKKAQDTRAKQLQESVNKNVLNKFLTKRLTEETKAKQEEDRQAFEAASLARRTKERLIVNLLKQFIMFGNDLIKQDMRTQLLQTYTKIEKDVKVKSKGINYLLKLYGEDIPQMLQYFVEQEKQRSFSMEQQQYQDFKTPNSIDQINLQLESLTGKAYNQLEIYHEDEATKKLTKAQAHLDRVLKDIEKIKSIKMGRTDKKNLEDELKKFKDDQAKANAKKKVEMRQIEHGVLPKTVRNYSLDQKKDQHEEQMQIKIMKPKDLDLSEIHSVIDDQRLILPSESDKSKIVKNPLLKTIKAFQLYDLRLEEQKDQDAVRFFVKKNMKIFRNLFTRYSNTMGAASNVNNTFDAMQNKNTLITVAEILKMLKDFQISALQVSQKDALQMFRLINKDILKKKDKGQASLTVLEFEGFVELMLQLAVHIYSYESELTPQEYLQKLFDHFKSVAVKTKSNLAKLFEDQTQSGVVDNNLIKELNKRLEKNPQYQLPDGFQKVVEKEIQNVYQIPPYLDIEECQRVSVEILDSFLNDLFGFHFLEPMAEIKEVARARPMLKVMARDKIISELNTQKPIVAKRQRSRMNGDRVSVSIDVNPIRNQVNMVKDGSNKHNKSSLFKSPRPSASVVSKPPLGVELKLQVARAPAYNRSHVLDTAYVLEEMLYSVENDLYQLPPPNYFLNPQRPKVINRVQGDKQKRFEEDEKQRIQDKQKLEIRKKILRDQLEKMKGEKDKQRKDDEEKKKVKDVKDEERKKAQSQKLMEQLESKKELWQKMSEPKNKVEVEKKEVKAEDKNVDRTKPNPETERKKKETHDALVKRKKELVDSLQKKTEERKASIVRDEESKNKKDKTDKIKSQQIKKMYHDTKLKQQEMKEKYKQEFQVFKESQEVQNVFILFDKGLQHFFDLASKIDSRDGGRLSYNAYVKLGKNAKICPTIISTQDYIYIYKTIMRGKKQFDTSVNYDSILDVQGTKLNYEDFKEALLKIACLGKGKLGGLSDQQQNDDPSASKQEKLSLQVKQSIASQQTSKGRSTSVKAEDAPNNEKHKEISNGVFEKEFDVQDMTDQTIANLLRTFNLKPDKSLYNQVNQNNSIDLGALNYNSQDNSMLRNPEDQQDDQYDEQNNEGVV